jgi:predicted metal-dependent hydrolase
VTSGLGPGPGGLTTIRLGEADVPVRLVRSARRRKTVSFGVELGVVVVRAPQRLALRQIEEMLRARSKWLATRLAAAPIGQTVEFAHGAAIPYMGGEVTIRVVSGKSRVRVELVANELFVYLPDGSPSEAVAPAVERWLRARAADLLPALVDRWSSASGLAPARVIVKPQRRRWGSCGADGTLRLNWRLVMMPVAVAEYVVVHELAHLRERNHGPRFWSLVESLMPDFRARRTALRG